MVNLGIKYYLTYQLLVWVKDFIRFNVSYALFNLTRPSTPSTIASRESLSSDQRLPSLDFSANYSMTLRPCCIFNYALSDRTLNSYNRSYDTKDPGFTDLKPELASTQS